MSGKIATLLLATAILAACQEHQRDRIAGSFNEDDAPTNEQAVESDGKAASQDEREPLSEGPIDPKSAEGAGQVVQSYGALIEQRRLAEAAELWANPSESNALVSSLAAPEIHLEIGAPGQMEGAAGSSYVTVPVVFYGKAAEGESFRRPADVILRRVNDVPGSTEEQRRWHIERIDLQPRR